MSSFMFEGIYLSLWSFWRGFFGYEVKPEVEFVKIKMLNPCEIQPPLCKKIKRGGTILEWDGLDVDNINWKTQHYA